MKVEYIYNIIQLFGVLLGTIGIFIIFKVQNLDTRINADRKNIVTSIAQYEAEAELTQQENPRTYDQLVAHKFLIWDASLDKDLLKKINEVIRKSEAQGRMLPMSYLITIRDKWNDLREMRTNIIISIKYPIIISAVIIISGLIIAINDNFEFVNNIPIDKIVQLVILIIFMEIAFFGIIYISKYIVDSVRNL